MNRSGAAANSSGANQRLKLTGGSILVFPATMSPQGAPAALPWGSAASSRSSRIVLVLGAQTVMNQQPGTGEFAALNARAVEAWEALVGWWDDITGEADEFHRKLVIPATDRFLALRPGERVLDVACGNGGYARHLAAQGAEVVGFDGSRRFVELAQRRTTEGH